LKRLAQRLISPGGPTKFARPTGKEKKETDVGSAKRSEKQTGNVRSTPHKQKGKGKEGIETQVKKETDHKKASDHRDACSPMRESEKKKKGSKKKKNRRKTELKPADDPRGKP